jgi:hypothetical protein
MSKIKNQSLAGKKTTLPKYGELEIPTDGIIELEDEAIVESLLSMPEWVKVAEEKAPEEKPAKTPPAKDELDEKLKALSLEQLTEMVGAYPKEEWSKFVDGKTEDQAKKLLIVYIKKKLA